MTIQQILRDPNCKCARDCTKAVRKEVKAAVVYLRKMCAANPDQAYKKRKGWSGYSTLHRLESWLRDSENYES